MGGPPIRAPTVRTPISCGARRAATRTTTAWGCAPRAPVCSGADPLGLGRSPAPSDDFTGGPGSTHQQDPHRMREEPDAQADSVLLVRRPGRGGRAALRRSSRTPRSVTSPLRPGHAAADEGGRRPDRRLHPRRAALHRPQRRPQFQFNESISFQIVCKDQEESDRFYDRLLEAARRACAAGSRTSSASPGRSSRRS